MSRRKPAKRIESAAEARRRLDELVGWGVVHDIFGAQESSSILAFIGRHAPAINQATFGAFFGSLQRILGNTLILAVARMYETEGRYPLRSIPAALKHLTLHHDTLPISDRGAVLHAIHAVGGNDADVQDARDGSLTLAAAEALSRRCHALQSVAGHAIKTIRDKVIAHHELVESAALPKTTYAAIDELIEFATELVVMVGHGYTDVVYRTDDEQYYLTSDAEGATRSLKRLLAAAGVPLSDEPPGDAT